jgi:hydroxypyruvate isomerase
LKNFPVVGHVQIAWFPPANRRGEVNYRNLRMLDRLGYASGSAANIARARAEHGSLGRAF